MSSLASGTSSSPLTSDDNPVSSQSTCHSRSSAELKTSLDVVKDAAKGNTATREIIAPRLLTNDCWRTSSLQDVTLAPWRTSSLQDVTLAVRHEEFPSKNGRRRASDTALNEVAADPIEEEDEEQDQEERERGKRLLRAAAPKAMSMLRDEDNGGSEDTLYILLTAVKSYDADAGTTVSLSVQCVTFQIDDLPRAKLVPPQPPSSRSRSTSSKKKKKKKKKKNGVVLPNAAIPHAGGLRATSDLEVGVWTDPPNWSRCSRQRKVWTSLPLAEIPLNDNPTKPCAFKFNLKTGQTATGQTVLVHLACWFGPPGMEVDHDFDPVGTDDDCCCPRGNCCGGCCSDDDCC